MTARDGGNLTRSQVKGQTLDTLCGSPFALGRFLDIAIGITEALGGLHNQNILHKDIRPQTILVDVETGVVSLIDPSAQQPRSVGTGWRFDTALAYMSPEQLGKSNRVVDFRSDLYSLGVTLYEMLTGGPPFQADDLLEWVHCHVARIPTAPTQLIPAVSEVVSAIVMKLLAKTVEERYQTALGLNFDLKRCLDLYNSSGTIETFPLAEADISDQLLIPEKLYGRKKDIALLFGAFGRVVKRGIPEMVMIAGYSGIGKTSLVRELYKPVIRKHGFFISGKFDQYKRNIPYATIIEAFQGLIRQILTEKENRLAAWKVKLQKALGLNSQIIIDIIPQVELIIGEQPPIPKLPMSEAKKRFNMVFQQFIGVFAKEGHPLVMFLDDLQWVDSASLNLIEHIIADRVTGHLLLIGAYRDNEVFPSDPLMLAIGDIRKSSAIFQTITLCPLSFEDLGWLLADIFQLDLRTLELLTRLIYEKTAGNPFFVFQFLMMLHSEHLIKFDAGMHRWEWDIKRIQAKDYTDNVIDLMTAKLRKLPDGARDALRIGACIGNNFDLHCLALITQASDEEVRENLKDAVEETLLLPLQDNRYSFFHDRVQQAAYSLIPEKERTAVHLKIGRLLLDQTASSTLDDQLFDIVNHFNLSTDLISNREERYRVAELDLAAARKAKASTAYASALNHLSAGITLMGEAGWDMHYDLTFDLYRELAEVEYLSSDYARSKELIDLLLNKARSDIQRAELYNILIVQYTLMAQYQDAIDIGRKALHLFQINIPESQLKEELDAEISRYKEILGGRKISSLIDEPTMSDPEKRVGLELLSNLVVPARYTDSMLFALISILNVNLSLIYGPTSKSTVGYTAFGMVLNSVMNNYQDAHAFGELSLKLSERFDDPAQKCQSCFMLGHYLSHWVKHLKCGDKVLNEGFRDGLAAGEMQWTGYILAYKLFQPFYRGVQIDLIIEEIPALLSFTRKTKNQWATDTLLGLQLAISPLGLERSAALEANHDSVPVLEESYLAVCETHKSFGAMGRYAVLQAQILYMFGHSEDALLAVEKADQLGEFFSSSISVVELNFFGSLILAALYDDAPDEKKIDYLNRIADNQVQMKTWVDNCEENFKHQYLLVEAERARIGGKQLHAMQLYEQAVQSASDTEFINNEGLANELASRFYQHWGFATNAHAYLREARICYLRWGASGKVAHLDKIYPILLQEEEAGITRALGMQIDYQDAIAVIKASQAISGEIVFSKLLETLMRTVLENAGAQKGRLILAHGDKLTVQAEADIDGQTIEVVQPRPNRPAGDLPISMLNYVNRTNETVIIDDATEQNMFSSDPYIEQNRPVSVLCLPLMLQSNLKGMLYLENGLVKAAFTKERVAVLELLSAQAAISLENAALYQERSRAGQVLRESEKKYRAIFEHSGTALVFIEEDMTITICNKEFEKLSGYSKDEVEGRMKWTKIVAKQDDLDRMKEYHRLRRIDPGASPQVYEFQFIDREDRLKDVVATVSMMPEMKQSLAALLDITERKQTEASLQDSEGRHRLVVDESPDPMVAYDMHGKALFVNPAFTRVFGWTPEELMGGKIDYVPADVWPETQKMLEKLKKGESHYGFETRRYDKNKRIIDISMSFGVWQDDKGNPAGSVVTLRDITQQKKLEGQLRQAQKMESIGTLAGGIAHDFNNILSAITGFTELALNRLPDNPIIKQYLEKVLQSGYRARDLVQQILSFSRTTEQGIKSIKTLPILMEAMKLLRATIPTTIQIYEHWEAQNDTIRGNPTQIHQVLMNLCTNASHAMKEKSGVLEVFLSNINISTQTTVGHFTLKPGAYLKLTVQDTGQGIPAEDMEKIFDPYFTTKTKGEGTGLGLSIIHGIVKDHGGAVGVSSTVGQGTTFDLFFPLRDKGFVCKTDTSKQIQKGRGTILLVDDEADLVDAYGELMSSLGYKVQGVTCSRKALDIYRADPKGFDLVFTDYTMPHMTGLQMAEELLKIQPDLPIILYSGYSQDITTEMVKVKGIRHMMTKPLIKSELAKVLHNHLHRPY